MKTSEPDATARPSADSGEETAVPDSAVEMLKGVELLVKDGDKTWVERVVDGDGEREDAKAVKEGGGNDGVEEDDAPSKLDEKKSD